MQKAYDRLVKIYDLEPHIITEEETRKWIGLTPKEAWKDLLTSTIHDYPVSHMDGESNRFPHDEIEYSIRYVGQLMNEAIKRGEARWYPDADRTLTVLKESGYSLFWLSNCTREYRDAHKEAFGLGRYFDEILCTEEFDYRPKHEIVRTLLETFPSIGMSVGDRAGDIEIGKKNTLAEITTVGCLYGYGTEEELTGADFKIRSLEELPEILSAK